VAQLFDAEGGWLKGNLHMHTTLSDGHLPPDEAAGIYKQAGYDFIALTDHWSQSETGLRDGLLVLSGCEWDTGNFGAKVFHIIGVGMDRPVPLSRSPKPGPQEIIDKINRSGGVAILAHPAWSVTDPDDLMALGGLAGVEIYNTVSGLPWNARRADSSAYVDICAARGRLLRCMAADDCHAYNGEQTRSFIMVKAKERSAESIKKAIADGNFYASQGPLFHSISVTEDTVSVRCTGVETVVFYSNTVWCDDRVKTGGTDCAAYKIKPTDRYLRIELIDADGRMAWSSPIGVNGGISG
jgi:Predicted metal-dependent phosphoesterases (PHP family)